MFGEVFDANPAFMSPYTTEGELQATLDFGFQAAARSRSRKGSRRTSCATSSPSDDYYTDADSNAYQLPTFLGNHDMGRIGTFLKQRAAPRHELLRGTSSRTR